MMRAINPTNEEVLEEVPYDSAEVWGDALSRAESAAIRWRATSIFDRSTKMRALARALRHRHQELATRMAKEMGKPRNIPDRRSQYRSPAVRR